MQLCAMVLEILLPPPPTPGTEQVGDVLLEEQIPAAILQETGVVGRPCVNIFGSRTRNNLLDGWQEVRKQYHFDWVHLSGGWSNPGAIESNLTRGLSGDVPFSARTVDDVIQQSTNKELPTIRFEYPLAWQGIWATALREFAKDIVKTIPTNDRAGAGLWPDVSHLYLTLRDLAEDYLDKFNKSEFSPPDSITIKELSRVAQTLLVDSLGESMSNLQGRAKALLVPLKEQTIGQILKLGAPAFWSTGPFYNGKCDPFGKTTGTPFTAAYEHGFLTIEERVIFADRETEFGISNATGSVAIATTAANLFLIYLKNGPPAAASAYVKIAESRRHAAQANGKGVPWDHKQIDKYADGFAMTAKQVAPEVQRILGVHGDAAGLQYAFQVHIQRGLPTGVSLFPSTVEHAFVKGGNRTWLPVDTYALAKDAG